MAVYPNKSTTSILHTHVPWTKSTYLPTFSKSKVTTSHIHAASLFRIHKKWKALESLSYLTWGRGRCLIWWNHHLARTTPHLFSSSRSYESSSLAFPPSFGFSPRHCIVHPSQQQQTHILCVSALFIFFFPNFLSYVCVRECLVDGLSAKADGQTQKVWDKKNQFFLFIFLGLVKICNWTNETMAGGVQGASIDRSVWLFATERIIM